MIKTNILHNRLAARLFMACLMAVSSFACVQAENKVTVEDIIIKPGEEKTVAVFLENSDNINALQMDITLPEGIDYVDNSLTRDEVRLDRDNHSLFMNSLSARNLRLLIVPSDTFAIVGNSGAVAYFKVRAQSGFGDAGDIKLTNILGSNHELDEDGFTKKFEINDYSAKVYPYVGRLYSAADTLAIKTDGTSKKVSLVLDNFINVRGMQALVALPQGLSFEVKDNGKPKFEYGSRLPQNATISSNITADGKLKIAVAGMTTENFAGSTGEVLAFYVKADETLPLKSDVVVSDIIVSDEAGKAFGVADTTLVITNSYLAHYTPAKALVDSLRNLYNEAVDSIAANAANVKDNEDILAAQAAIVAKIDSLQKVVDDSYAAETLAEGYADVMAAADEIGASIKALIDNALAAQGNMEAVNEEANKRLTAEIASLQAELDAAKETINTECKDVADQFTEVIDSIQTRITEITDSVKTAYEAIELTAESTIDSLSVKESIAQLLADAKAAQAVVDANEAAYSRLTAEIEALQAELDAAEETVNTECKDVAAQFVDDIKAIQNEIDKIAEAVESDYEAVKLTAESTIDSQSVKDAIEKLLADAAQAQKEFDEATGIYGITINDIQNGDVEIYDVTGKRQNSLVRGKLNIVKYSNGKISKILVK